MMQNTIPILGAISWGRRLMPAAAALGLLLVLGFAQPASAQTALAQTPPPLTLSNNYFVTGDYVVGAVGLRGSGDSSGFARGTISIPDSVQAQATGVPSPGVPVGAYTVAAFLYWETVEKDKQALTGQNGFFNGYPIAGAVLGNNTAPPGWSSGGCTGSSGGNSTTTLRAYRADVRPFLPVDANGNIQTPNAVTPGSYEVRLADSGSMGGGTPLTLGATLVIIYRVQASPAFPLNAIVLYDGAFAPSNQTNPEMALRMQGFYQPDGHKAKMTHIAGDGATNKSESVMLGNVTLLNLYPANPTNATVAFPAVYNSSGQLFNGSWDTATWDVSPLVKGGVTVFDTSETTTVVAAQSGGGCVDWGAVIFSTTVRDTDGDGLLDVWEDNQGYTDWRTVDAAGNSPWVALPGADKNVKDIFVEVDYLRNLSSDYGSAGTYLHSHLPKQAALDKVGDAFSAQNIHIHFDLGPGIYQGDPYVIPYPVPLPNPLPPNTVPPPASAGGKAIPESATLCNDASSPTLCEFPGTPAVGWKAGFLFVKNNPTVTLPNNTTLPLGNFQSGRNHSYHEALFAHALGAPRSFWTAFAATLSRTSVAKLISIINSGTSATVTIQTPQGVFKPGDCNPANLPPACTDANGDRVTVTGAVGQPALNGTYLFASLHSSLPDANGVTTTTFTITTSNKTTTCTTTPCVADGTYNFSKESRLAVGYGGPTSKSGQSDVGGGDTAETFGLWPFDDLASCQADPSQPLTGTQDYCNNQVGNVQGQGGTLLHELGHTFFLTHGGTFFPNGTSSQGKQINNPLGLPSYGLNCNPGFLSSMSYLFQIRGFPDLLPDGSHPIDYSGQTLRPTPLQPLDETHLNESIGIGSDMFTNMAAPHFTRWYAPPSPLDMTAGGPFATRHCNGTPILDGAQMVRVDGSTLTEPSGFSGPIDWNNDGNTTDTGLVQDINFNDNFFNSPAGSNVDSPFAGFNDWINIDLLQVGSRANAFGLSGGGADASDVGTGIDASDVGTGIDASDVGTGADASDVGTGIDASTIGSGPEQDVESACSTADPPRMLTAVLGSKSVILNWKRPDGPCQVKMYNIFKSTNGGAFKMIGSTVRTVNPAPPPATFPPPTTFTDTNVKNGDINTYLVRDVDTQGATSPASNQVTITVSFK
jgi:hypothetical protein